MTTPIMVLTKGKTMTTQASERKIMEAVEDARIDETIADDEVARIHEALIEWSNVKYEKRMRIEGRTA